MDKYILAHVSGVSTFFHEFGGRLRISHSANGIFPFKSVFDRVFFNLNWYHVVKHDFIDDKVDTQFLESQKKINLILPFSALIAMGVALIAPEYSSLVYLAIFFVRRIHF